MAHKTLIDGTAYEISGGRTLVNGTRYDIASGKTLVAGTAYEVGFSSPIILLANSYSSDLEVTVNGNTLPNTYYEPGMTIDNNSVIDVVVFASQFYLSKIAVNGTVIASAEKNTEIKQTIDISDATHVMTTFQYGNNYTQCLNVSKFDFSAPKDITVTVSASFAGSGVFAKVVHNGVEYSDTTSFTAKTGDILVCRRRGDNGDIQYFGQRILTPSKYSDGWGEGYIVLNSDTTVYLTNRYMYGSEGNVNIEDENNIVR